MNKSDSHTTSIYCDRLILRKVGGWRDYWNTHLKAGECKTERIAKHKDEVHR